MILLDYHRSFVIFVGDLPPSPCRVLVTSLLAVLGCVLIDTVTSGVYLFLVCLILRVVRTVLDQHSHAGAFRTTGRRSKLHCVPPGLRPETSHQSPKECQEHVATLKIVTFSATLLFPF